MTPKRARNVKVKVEYRRKEHACQNDRLGVFGKVVDILGWRDAMHGDPPLLCPLEVLLVRAMGDDLGIGAPKLVNSVLYGDGGELRVRLERAFDLKTMTLPQRPS